jgi:MinD superfamily P-loop ATPase
VKQLVILSGKGGTGKTSVAAALAHLASQHKSLVMADGDVDAANLELVLDPVHQATRAFMSGQEAVIDVEQCTACGTCAEVCRFDAILPDGDGYRVDGVACEGCAACFYSCPAGAVRMEEQQAGNWFRSETRFGPLFHAHLFAGQENSGKLVTRVKRQAQLWAPQVDAELMLVDGPPGIGCPVISALSGADLALLVVEPTVSGAHDLERVLGIADHFRVEAVAVLNKADLNPAQSDRIAAFCERRGVEVLGRIPYDTVITQAMVEGLPVTAYTDGPVTQALRAIWARLAERLFAT